MISKTEQENISATAKSILDAIPDAAPPGGLKGMRVLLIEDNEDHLLLVRRALEERSHFVTSVSKGEDALTAIREAKPDVVALDYQLPDATGLEVLAKIRALTKSLPVVMVTASGSEQVAVNALKNGACDYVAKSPGYERELPRALELAVAKALADEEKLALLVELERRATTDPLTGLMNRSEMEEVIAREIQRPDRPELPMSFSLMDVDGFKTINDTHGHQAGDAVLWHIGRVLKKSIRSSDYAARWGGDEFAVLLPTEGFGAAKAFARRLRSLLLDLRSTLSEENLPAVTMSVGMVSVLNRGAELPVLMHWSDRALYAAKAGGRDGARFFVLKDGEDAIPGETLACDLQTADEPCQREEPKP